MQRHGRFPAAGDPLDDQRRIFGRTDNSILLGLDRRNDIAKPIILIFAEPVHEKLVAYGRSVAVAVVRIRHPFENALANHDVAFQVHQSVNQAFGSKIRSLIPAGKRIKQTGDRRAPIDNERVPRFRVADAHFADIDRRPFSARFRKIKPAEIRLTLRLLQLFPLRFAVCLKQLLRKIMPRVYGDAAQLFSCLSISSRVRSSRAFSS